MPFGSRSQVPEGAIGVGTAPAADYRLGKENREGHKQAGYNIKQDERRTAILSQNVRKAPDVSQADGGTRHGHYHRRAAAEILPLFHHNTSDTIMAPIPRGATYLMRK